MASDTGRWLEELGLGEYSDLFAEEEVDVLVLCRGIGWLKRPLSLISAIGLKAFCKEATPV